MIIALQTLLFFRETLVRALDALLRPYYKNFSLTLHSQEEDSDDEDSEDHVFAEYHDEKGVVFFPAMYIQRYAAVSDCLMDERWCGKLEKVVDFGYHDVSFIKYLKEVPGIRHILGVDIESIPLQSSSDLLGYEDYIPKREHPLKVTLFQGNAADPDYRLIGCDAVIGIEMIEHMLPHDLDRFVHTVFGFIKPWVVVLTTPNGDFNILFKSLEKNGLRRLDHFFEWSREQFHDWCSNIVLRYPQYTVLCKGIGPGPPDMAHVGCCSQMAIFIANNYNKQQDLDLNSLALVASKDAPSLSLDDITSSYECIPDNHLLCLTNEIEQHPDLTPNKLSCVTIVLSSPIYAYPSTECKDKGFQCNLDTEQAKQFLFEDDACNLLVPRRRKVYRTYQFEDVNNRLNCSTLQVKKFSKTTQSMMAKTRMDSLVHTRAVVDEIRHLTKMLNFNKNSCNQYGENYIWYNINWGDNAPYWNQYYKVVRDYTYPFEKKSDDCRILDLITEEINRLVDKQWDEDLPVDVNKLEIPLEQLMQAVKHITDDVNKVKELLEWNGYQIVDDVVIHSRLVVDTVSMGTHDDEWPDNDTVSEWDSSDVPSNSLSDGSTNAPDFYDRCLRRALDNKVKKLRSLLSKDEDITYELDRVVCRLLKLALHTSRSRQTPVPASWVQCKLFDLLTLTEKAIERRRKRCIEDCNIKALENGGSGNSTSILAMNNMKENDRADKIMYKYRHLLKPLEDDEKFHYNEYNSDGTLVFDDDTEFFKDETAKGNAEVAELDIKEENIIVSHNTKAKLDIVREWISEGCENISQYQDHVKQNKLTFYAQDKVPSESSTSDSSIPKRQDDNRTDGTSLSSYDSIRNKIKFESRVKKSKTVVPKIARKPSKKKLNYTLLLKNYYIKFGSIDSKLKRKVKGYRELQTIAAPIPNSLIDLCQSPKKENLECREDAVQNKKYVVNNQTLVNCDNIAATEKSYIISIITQDTEEEVALRRSVGTEPDASLIDHEANLETVINVTKQDSLGVLRNNDSEDVHSQTIFLYDINEPSTSKGIRHTGLDAQCGPDQIPHYCMLSATTSFNKLPNLLPKSIKIDCSKTTLHAKRTFDMGTSPDRTWPYSSPRITFTGIRINDSDTNLPATNKTDSYTMTPNVTDIISRIANADSIIETTWIKPELIRGKTDETISECSTKSPIRSLSPLNKSDVQVQSCSSKTDVHKMSPRSVRSKLSCGGIYVHSFKGREVSEDVVYQGGWNDMRSEVLTKRNPKIAPKRVIYTTRKVKRGSNTCVKNNFVKNEIYNASKRPAQIRAPRQSVLKKEQANKTVTSKKVTPPVKYRNHKLNKNVKKVSSKLATSITPKRNYIKDKQMNPTFYKNIENYLPPYLKRNRSPAVGNTYLPKSMNVVKPNNVVPPCIRANTEKIRDTANTAKGSSRIYVNYQVFRNEVENKRVAGNIRSVNQEMIGNNSTPKRSFSPVSQNSTCSSPNSIRTVRDVSSIYKMNSNKNCSTSSNVNSRTKSTMVGPTKNFSSIVKNIIKRKKNENKENIPTAKATESLKDPKQGFVGITKNVFRANMNSESSPLQSAALKLSKSRTQFKKSSLKLPNISSRLILRSSTSLLTKKVLNDDEPSLENDIFAFNSSDTVFVLKSQKDLKAVDEPPVCDNREREKENTVEKTCSNKIINDDSLETTIKNILDESLNSICSIPEITYVNNDCSDNSSAVENLAFNITSSPTSFKTVVENECSSEFKINLEDVINTSFNNGTSSVTVNLTDTVTSDLKSMESMGTSSKYSEYFLADTKSDVCEFSSINNETNSSVQGLFERIDNMATNVGGPIALQAFSGFSMNSVPLAGDQPDYINLVDPETGILRPEINRLAESEEILISGRSSDTFESCFVEEDSFVPSWLFNIISQQHSVDESDDEEGNLVPFLLPVVEPVFDLNGNVTDGGVGVGAGAGDGRGMHSDHSQDSSGRGTSLSSSETSTSTPNEAIIVDPSAFIAQYEFIRDAADSVNVDRPNESPDTSFTTAEADNGDENRRSTRSRIAASDIEADVSSLDTDIADSDTFERD